MIQLFLNFSEEELNALTFLFKVREHRVFLDAVREYVNQIEGDKWK